MLKWYEDESIDKSVILSTRIRLARNLEKYPFSMKLNQEQIKELIADVKQGMKEAPNSVLYNDIDVYKLDQNEKLAMLEKHNISIDLMLANEPTSVILQNDESVAIMINEEDHIRIQTIVAGDNIDTAWERADQIDNILESDMKYAFHKDFGYLTACPTNAGTGMRASFMLHIPLLEMTGQLKNIIHALGKFGMVVRGIYGEGSESLGAIYQVSNQVTMGKSEQENILALRNFTNQMVEKEVALREQFAVDKRMIDKIYRSYGILAYARTISMKEAIEHLSNIRLGHMLDNINLPKLEKPIYQIIMEIQVGNLQKNAGRELGELERDIVRADYLRTLFV